MKLKSNKGLLTMNALRLPTPSMREDEAGNPVPVVPVITKRGDYKAFDSNQDVYDFVNGDHTAGEVPNGLDFQKSTEATVYLKEEQVKVFDPNQQVEPGSEPSYTIQKIKKVVFLDVLKNPLYAKSLEGADKEKFPSFVELYVHPHGTVEVVRQPINMQPDLVRAAISELRSYQGEVKKGLRILDSKGKVDYVDDEFIRLDLNIRKKGARIY